MATILGCSDVLCIVLREASKNVGVYWRLRFVCKRFCSILERVASFESLLSTLTDNGRVSIRHISIVPARALKLYIRSYPLRILHSYLTSRLPEEEEKSIRTVLTKQLQENEDFNRLAKEYILFCSFDSPRTVSLQILLQMLKRFANYHISIFTWHTLAIFIKYLTFTEEKSNRHLVVYYTSAIRAKVDFDLL